MNELEIFKSAEFGDIRTMIVDNEPWFVGKDLTKCLGYNNFAMLGNGLKWSFPNICVTNLLLVEWKFIISTRE